MNGKTHQIAGIGGALGVTYLAVAGSGWVHSHLPEFAINILTPPRDLLVASGATDIAATLGSTVTSILSITLTLLLVALVGIVSGQLPDIDTPTSTISNSGLALERIVEGDHYQAHKRKRRRSHRDNDNDEPQRRNERSRTRRHKDDFGTRLFYAFLNVFFGAFNLLPHTTALIANRFFGHRGGIIHGVIGLFGFSFLFGLLTNALFHAPFYGVVFFGGYFSHLTVDSLSKSGVKWFWPLSDKSHHLLPRGIRFDTSNDAHNALAQVASLLLIVAIAWGIASISIIPLW